MPVEPLSDTHPPLRLAQKKSILLNLPAIVPAAIIGAIFFSQGDLATLCTAFPFIILLWYAIGRWLDGLLGYCSRVRLPWLLRRAISVPAFCTLLLGIDLLTPLYHHRNEDTYLIASSLILWSALCLAVAYTTKDNRTGKA